jgi:hypothetical protein
MDVGKIHNDLVKIMVMELPAPPTDINEVKAMIHGSSSKMCAYLENELNLEKSEVSKVIQSMDFDKIISTNFRNDVDPIRQIDNLPISQGLKESMKKIIEGVESSRASTPMLIEAIANKYYTQEHLKLSRQDKEMLNAMKNVLVSSAELWLPKEKGGEGYYEKLNGKKYNVNARGLGIFGIFVADAVGIVGGAAGSVAASGGASAIPNPLLGGLPTASLVGVIVGATSSVQKAIN